MDGPFPGIRIAGPNDLVELQPMEVLMGYDWIAYFNQKVLSYVNGATTRRLSYVQFGQDLDGGWLYVIPSHKDDYGAEKLEFSPTEHAAQSSLFLALLPFHLDRQEGRNRLFKCEVRELGKGKQYLALNVKESELVPARTVKKSGETAKGGKGQKSSADAAADTAAAGKQPEPPAGAQQTKE